jgi:hypothetical protein
MPFKSKAQMRFMFARHPEIAKRWTKEYGTPKKLPEHVLEKASKKGGRIGRRAKLALKLRKIKRSK